VITKVNSSKDNTKSTRHVKRRLKSSENWETPELLRWTMFTRPIIW
jgi:hypothetical protein